MNHFNKKNFSFIKGAGGPKPPKPPPPPTLKPPVMGDLQAISSYEYVENVDLISDGSIDGLVNQRGEYVNDAGIFEGIYLEDVPVKQSATISGDNILQSFDLSFIATGFSGKISGFSGHYYDSNNNFLDKPLSSGVFSLTGYLSGVGYSVLNSKKDIANSVYSSIQEVNTALNSASYSPETDIYKQLRSIGAKFNYKSSKEIQSYLLPNFPQEFDEDYPFFCLKLTVTGDSVSNYKSDMFTYLDSNLANQTYLPLESTELQNRRFITPPPKIDLTYCDTYSYISGNDNITSYRLCGSMYVFAYKENDRPLQNSIDAIINNIKSIKLIDSTSKYNVGNASMEIRNGDELQKPLSLFNKTYLDKNYGTLLRGPFAKERVIPTLYSTPNILKTAFNKNAENAQTGVDLAIINDVITDVEHTRALSDTKNKALKDSIAINKYAKAVIGNGSTIFRILNSLESPNDAKKINFTVRMNLVFIVKKGFDTKKVNYIRNIQITLDKTEGKFDSNMIIFDGGYNAGPFPIIKTPNGYVQSSTDTIACRFSHRENDAWWYYTVDQTSIGGLLRACLDFALRAQGSDDTRLLPTKTSYSNWNKEYVKNSSEPSIPIVHVVNNPNVDRVYISMSVRVLRDIAHRETYLERYKQTNLKVDAGTSLPSLINFRIEIGYQDKDGTETIIEGGTKDFQIKGTADSPASIDIGREENNTAAIIPQYSRFIMGAQQSFAAPLILPPAQPNQTRFVRIYRTTYESYSSLVKREISLEKVSEIINLPFSYPYSTICGLKLDARTLPQIPSRSYDARFKKVFVPSNYFPLKANGKDKRYLTSSELVEFKKPTYPIDDKIIYRGNWDGTFKLAWTDNPAWIIFDLLINRRYGLGNFISPTQVNYWELYKIAQFCDAVDVTVNKGVFVGVPAADGGLEPRYGFNGVIADKTNVFDMIKSIVASFRGNMFYTNSEINFTNDRLKPIMSSFNNSNVKDGTFSYTNSRKDLQYNVIEVSYLDRDDLFKEKIEYVEDPDDIKTRGILRTSAQTFGVTSRAHAKRIGQHTIYSTINEDQNVQFVGGLETLLCRPGDLISINDELRTLKKHVGRVLDVDLAGSIIHTNIDLTAENFSSTGLSPQLSVLIPTGKNQFDDFYNLAKSPSRLNISELYQTDIPQNVVFNASGTGFDSYGTKFYLYTDINQNSGLPLLENIKIGVPCSVTLANTSQEIYKIQSIKELNLNEYEIIASKFDSGKFAEIEVNQNLNDFYSSFPSTRQTQVNEGSGFSVSNQAKYDLSGVPLITSFTTGNFDKQNDVIDINGTWQSVDGANSYNVELITPKYRSIKKQTSFNSVVFEDQSEVGVFKLKVSAVQTGVYPVLISASHSATLKVLSYTAPVRSNGILTNMGFSPRT
jgi:hypothetical protein